jgi:hypothetical protein
MNAAAESVRSPELPSPQSRQLGAKNLIVPYKKTGNAPWTHPSHANRFRRGLAIRSGWHRVVGTHYRFRVISGSRSGAGE